jgi:hypothetical protein
VDAGFAVFCACGNAYVIRNVPVPLVIIFLVTPSRMMALPSSNQLSSKKSWVVACK